MSSTHLQSYPSTHEAASYEENMDMSKILENWHETKYIEDQMSSLSISLDLEIYFGHLRFRGERGELRSVAGLPVKSIWSDTFHPRVCFASRQIFAIADSTWIPANFANGINMKRRGVISTWNRIDPDLASPISCRDRAYTTYATMAQVPRSQGPWWWLMWAVT